MIDLKKAEEEFIKYTEKYDLNNENINRKQKHSLRVMKLAIEIAKDNNLSQEDIELATLIGLLHDIARFEQEKRFHTFNDLFSFDHGNVGVEILKENNFIRNFIEDDSFDNIIFKAIENHNKYKIEDGLNDKELLHAKIIRDADKIDIIYLMVDTFFANQIEEVENSKITDTVYNQFLNCKHIKREKEYTKADSVLTTAAFIFDLNFDYSKRYLNKEKYIIKILDRFDFKDQDTKMKIKEVKNIVNNYLTK